MLQDLGSNHLPVVPTISFSLIFCPNERPLYFNFQNARWHDFAFYFGSHFPSTEEHLSLFSAAAALFTSQTLNVAKSSIPFGRIKRHSKVWWSAEMEEAVSKRHKAFAAAHRSDEDHLAYISASRRDLSVITKAKPEAWQATCFFFSYQKTLKNRAPEAGQLPRDWTRGRRYRVGKSEWHRVRSWAVQNQLRGVLEQVSAGRAKRQVRLNLLFLLPR